MTEAEWLASNDPDEMYCRVVWHLGASRRRMDLFCVACARLVLHLMDDSGARRAFEWLEANPGQRERPSRPGGGVSDLFRGPGRALQRWHDRRQLDVSGGATHVAFDLWADWYEYAFPNVWDYFDAQPGILREDPRVYLPAVIRDIFCFPPVAIDPAWVTPNVTALCRGMYEPQDFGAMPTLAAALQDAGCMSARVLDHCRATNTRHVRGCWLLDLILGNE